MDEISLNYIIGLRLCCLPEKQSDRSNGGRLTMRAIADSAPCSFSS
ncbi:MULTISPECIES: hypothetical protein [unclassified Coleofasciculus]|nr:MULTISPECIES: hypothetical protein [unclassified Coleofasciculus]MBD1840047.1 hypothetical protein [Coleofasciculus sp. FACHB-501]